MNPRGKYGPIAYEIALWLIKDDPHFVGTSEEANQIFEQSDSPFEAVNAMTNKIESLIEYAMKKHGIG